MRVLYGMLDQASVNSFIVYNLLEHNKLMNRKQFMLDLTLELVKPFLSVRLTNPTLQTTLRLQVESFLDYNQRDNQKIKSSGSTS